MEMSEDVMMHKIPHEYTNEMDCIKNKGLLNSNDDV